MKNKLMDVLFATVFGLVLLVSFSSPRSAFAGSAVVSPKAAYNLNFTTSASTITIGPGALYEVTLSTGASGEFVAFFDTNTFVSGLNVSSNIINNGLKTRLFYGSTTANTQIRFDPPLLFTYGIQAVDSSGAGQATITYEEGRGLSGQ